MSDITVESLQIEVQASSTQAEKSISSLANTLGKLKNATKNLGLNGVAKQFSTLNTALNGISGTNADNLNKLAQGLQTLSTCGNLKLSSSVATQITNISSAIQSLNGTNFGALNSLANALTPLANIGKSNLNSFISQLQRLPQAVQVLSSVNIGSLGTQISQLVSALTPLTQMGKNNLTSFITQLQKLPQVMTALRSVDMGALASQIQQLANALAPLATQMQSIANGFSAFPARIQRLIRSTNSLTTANNGASMSYANLAAKIGIAVVAMKRIASTIAGWITKSNEYIENLNLFTVSMGEYANEAQKYAETVAEIMGIDPGEWLRNQGIFMTLATGFGVVSDRAYTMSQNLTQLGYDLSSFFNISYEDAFQKLQSGISGELEPLRRLGFDLSVARLQQEALNLGIQKSVNAMTQAEKAELRYYAIMTQVTAAQGDMARTLNAPANQLRVLKAQVTQCARSLGNIFIPVLNAVLPYAIALAKAIRLVANAIANLFGFALPEVDYSGISSAAGGVGDIADGLGDATDKAKELKNALLGIDELNIISPPEDSSGGGGGGGIGGGGGLGFELPTYDFLGDAVNSKVEEILTKMKEWLGLTEDINTWSEFFHTRLGRILTTIGAIGLGLATWKVSQSVLTGIQGLLALKKVGLGKGLTFSIGLSLAVTGIALEATAIIDTIKNELDKINFTKILSGGGLLTASGAFIGKAVAGWITSAFSGSALATALSTAATNLGTAMGATVSTAAGGAILGAGIGGIIAGLPAFFTGIYDSIKHGIDWLSASLTAIGGSAAGASIGAICAAAGTAITPGIGTLIGLAVGLVVDGIILVVQKWDIIKAWWTGTVVPFFESIPQKISEIVSAVGQWFSELPGKIGYALGYAYGSVVKWISDTYNTIKEKVPEIITKIKTFFAELPEKIWNAIIAAKNKIVSWASEMIEKVKEKVPEIIDSIVNFFKEIPDKLKALGEDIWQGLVDGLTNAWETITTAVSDFCSNFLQGFKDALGIASPSKEFEKIGGYSADGLIEGVYSKFSAVKDTVTEWGNKIIDWFTNDSDGSINENSFATFGENIIGGFKDKVSSTYTNAKTSITTWATKVKSWFSGTASSSAFAEFATDVINGFKNEIGNAYTDAKSNMQTFASKVKSWFTDKVSYNAFYNVASDVISGFKNGIGNLYTTMKNTITSWGSSVINWFKDKLGIQSPSKVFYEMAGFSVEGFNNGFSFLGKSTKGVVNSWADSFTAVKPTMSFAVDTSALKYYNGDSFAKTVSASVSANSNFSVDTSHIREEFREAVLEALNESRLAEDMRRQADKREQTIVQIGNRTVTDAVTTQQRANGYRFATT